MRSIPSSLQNKLTQRIQSVANNADPRMTVAVTRAKQAVTDAAYWTVETIRELEATGILGDIAVDARRFKPYGPPNRLYDIHVFDGVVWTAFREYPDIDQTGWVNQFTVGNGSSVAIAFDGHWERYRDRWRFVSDEVPYIAWVDGAGVLWEQLWDDATSKGQLATDVTQVTMMRAWKNTAIPELDQGVIAAYIKTDGKVYYRSYCQQADYSAFWEIERELTGFTGTAVSVNMFRTHDYRMGFIIEDSSGNVHWMITPRNWAGMASPAETIRATPSVSLEWNKIEKPVNDSHMETIQAVPDVGLMDFLYAGTTYKFVEASNPTGLTIAFRTDYPIVPAAGDFSIIDESSVSYYGISIAADPAYPDKKDAGKYWIVTMDDFNNAIGAVTLTCNGTASTNQIGGVIDPFSIVFTPEGLVPFFVDPPVVEEVWNE